MLFCFATEWILQLWIMIIQDLNPIWYSLIWIVDPFNKWIVWFVWWLSVCLVLVFSISILCCQTSTGIQILMIEMVYLFIYFKIIFLNILLLCYASVLFRSNLSNTDREDVGYWWHYVHRHSIHWF